jgi:hypothetical protein
VIGTVPLGAAQAAWRESDAALHPPCCGEAGMPRPGTGWMFPSCARVQLGKPWAPSSTTGSFAMPMYVALVDKMAR